MRYVSPCPCFLNAIYALLFVPLMLYNLLPFDHIITVYLSFLNLALPLSVLNLLALNVGKTLTPLDFSGLCVYCAIYFWSWCVLIPFPLI